MEEIDIVTNIDAVENRTVYIECPVNGIPPPSIMWMKDRMPLLDFPYPRMETHSSDR